VSQDSNPVPKGYVVNPGRTEIDYGQAIQFVFQNPNWIANLVLAAVCYLPFACFGRVPYVGRLIQQFGIAIAVGYGWEGSASLLATNGTRYADFDFNRITVYLSRSMGWLAVAIASYAVSMGIEFGVVGFSGTPNEAQVMALLTSYGVVAIVGVVMNFFMQPMMFRAGLTGNIADTFDFEWGWGFFQKMWLEMLISALLMIVVSIVAVVAGLLLLCIGVLLAPPFIQLVRGHLDYQLYELYLNRGGIPVTGVAPTALGGYTPDLSNPYASPAGGGYTRAPIHNPPPGSSQPDSSPPPSWPPPPEKPNG
jgi:hypothetical protein